MGGFSSTGYSGNTMLTQAGSGTAGGQLQALGGLNLDDILQARQRAKYNDMMMRLEEEKIRQQRESMKTRGDGISGNPDDYYTRTSKNLALQDQIARTQANTGVAPVRYVGGFNEPLHLAQDWTQMDAYQREAFMPKNSNFGSSR
jgi:hypothetical protein